MGSAYRSTQITSARTVVVDDLASASEAGRVDVKADQKYVQLDEKDIVRKALTLSLGPCESAGEASTHAATGVDGGEEAFVDAAQSVGTSKTGKKRKGKKSKHKKKRKPEALPLAGNEVESDGSHDGERIMTPSTSHDTNPLSKGHGESGPAFSRRAKLVEDTAASDPTEKANRLLKTVSLITPCCSQWEHY